LTLLNGRRVQTSYGGFFDLNSIPAAAVERIEVLPVGASAIYGLTLWVAQSTSILRNDLRGFEVAGKSSHTAGARNTDAQFGWGDTWEHGGLTLIGHLPGHRRIERNPARADFIYQCSGRRTHVRIHI